MMKDRKKEGEGCLEVAASSVVVTAIVTAAILAL
jgi:hypothetical protein